MRISKMTGFVVMIMTGVMLLVSVQLVASSAIAEDVVVICNPKAPGDALEKEDIRQIFLGKKTQWGNSQKIDFVVLKQGDSHKIFLKEFIGKTSAQYRNYWRKRVFTGKGRAPKTFKTPEELVAYVAETGGAIGYAPANAANENVRVISGQ